MGKKTFIEIRSFTIRVIFFMIGTSILIAPSGLSADAKQDGWIACLVGIAFGLLAVLLYVALGERYPGRSLVEYWKRRSAGRRAVQNPDRLSGIRCGAHKSGYRSLGCDPGTRYPY